MQQEISNILRLPKSNYEVTPYIDAKSVLRSNLEQIKGAFRSISQKIEITGEAFIQFVDSFKDKLKLGQSLRVFAVRVKNREEIQLYGQIK